MNCEACKCPLTRLKAANGRLEPRKKCARCTDQGAVDWKPPKATMIVNMKQSSVYRAPKADTERKATILKIDEFMNRRSGKRPGNG